MRLPVHEIDDPQLGKAEAGPVQKRRGEFPGKRRLRREEGKEDQANPAQQQPRYDQQSVSEPVDQFPGKRHHRNLEEGPGAEDEADLHRTLHDIIEKVSDVGERRGGHDTVEKDEQQKPPEEGVLFQVVPRNDDRGRRRPALDAGPGGKPQRGKGQRRPVKDHRIVADEEEQGPHQDRRDGPAIGSPHPVGSVVFPSGMPVQKEQRLRVECRHDRIEKRVEEEQQDKDVGEFQMDGPCAGKILSGQTDHQCEDGHAEAEKGDEALPRLELVRKDSRRNVCDQADQRHHEKDQTDQAYGGSSVGMNEDMFVEDSEKRRADPQADKKKEVERFQIDRLALDGFHEGTLSGSAGPGSCFSG